MLQLESMTSAAGQPTRVASPATGNIEISPSPTMLRAVASASTPAAAAAIALEAYPAGTALMLGGRRFAGPGEPGSEGGVNPPAPSDDAVAIAEGVTRSGAPELLAPPSRGEFLLGAILALQLRGGTPGDGGRDDARRLRHDLRNQLCAITLNLQLLELQLGSAVDDGVARKLRAIAASVGKLGSALSNQQDRCADPSVRLGSGR